MKVRFFTNKKIALVFAGVLSFLAIVSLAAIRFVPNLLKKDTAPVSNCSDKKDAAGVASQDSDQIAKECDENSDYLFVGCNGFF